MKPSIVTRRQPERVSDARAPVPANGASRAASAAGLSFGNAKFRAPRGRHGPPGVPGGERHPAQPPGRAGPRNASSRTTSARFRTPPTPSTPPSAFPTSCRTCSAKGCFRRRSSPSMPASWRGRTTRRRAMWRAPWPRFWRWSLRSLVLAGVLATPYLIGAIAPGFSGAKRELTIRLVRILFPGAGLLVLSAWCLGILNSHRRFFLSYTAPVIWNVAMIATLVALGGRIGQFASGGGARLGIGGGQRAAVRRAAAAGCCRLARRLRFSLEPALPAAFARCCATSCPCSSAAASCRSAPTWTRCWRACCRPARWPRSPTRSFSTPCR